MLLFDKISELWRGKQPVSFVNLGAGYPGLFRAGRWVMTPTGVGILVSVGPQALKVALVGVNGETIREEMHAHGIVREAAAGEIPRSRCSYEQAVAKGYSP